MARIDASKFFNEHNNERIELFCSDEWYKSFGYRFTLEEAIAYVLPNEETPLGVYITHLNGDRAISSIKTKKYYLTEIYGVADTIDQILEYLKDIEWDHVIVVTRFNKKDEPAKDGWRWEKWGEYIGTKEPMAGYLYDEPEIESVLVWSAIPIDKEKYEVENAKFGNTVSLI